MFVTLLHCWRRSCLLVLVGLLTACSPESIVGDSLPPDVPDPGVTKTPAGARAAYYGALMEFERAFGGAFGGIPVRAKSFIPISALLADELRSGDVGLVGSFGFQGETYVDSRTLPEYGGHDTFDWYRPPQRVRGQAQEARGALATYAPEAPRALVGHLYALEGYADVFLADLFCSGIPLSTLVFEGDYVLEGGSTTHEVYQRAVALFDSAIALTADSTRLLHLAMVGKARALLALGQYAGAAEAVVQVPDGFFYELRYNSANPDSWNFARGFASGSVSWTMVDREGLNGLAYISSNDPRTAWVAAGTNAHGQSLYRPANYSTAGDSPIVLASGIEARLIEAEAALHGADGEWLEILNELRTDGSFTTQANAGDPAQTDTLWQAGTGGVTGLAPLTDPGTPDARVDLVFHERAFWLFLTGHRQGDLRRLVREYGRDPESVYPTGAYPGGNGVYRSDVALPIPGNERLFNPQFAGCLHRNA